MYEYGWEGGRLGMYSLHLEVGTGVDEKVGTIEWE